jgi:hypothetical protein
MTEQHIIIDSEQTLEAMLAPVGRDLLHYPCNNPPDAGKHCAKFRRSKAPNIIVTPLAAKSSYRPKQANCSAYSLHQTRAFMLLQSRVAPHHDSPTAAPVAHQTAALMARGALIPTHTPPLIFPLLLPIHHDGCLSHRCIQSTASPPIAAVCQLLPAWTDAPYPALMAYSQAKTRPQSFSIWTPNNAIISQETHNNTPEDDTCGFFCYCLDASCITFLCFVDLAATLRDSGSSAPPEIHQPQLQISSDGSSDSKRINSIQQSTIFGIQ